VCPVALVGEWQVRIQPDIEAGNKGNEENDGEEADHEDRAVVPGPDDDGDDTRNDIGMAVNGHAIVGDQDDIGDLDIAVDDDDEGNNGAEGVWGINGIHVVRVKMHPGVSNASVDCLERATIDMFLALLEALLASPLRQEVLEHARAHCPEYDSDGQPLTTLTRISRERGTYAARRSDVIGAPCVQALLRDSPAFRDCATGLYRVNLHPDARCLAPRHRAARRLDEDTAPVPGPIRVLTAIQGCANGNLDCIYIKLRSCPPAVWAVVGSVAAASECPVDRGAQH
jgi:hypothetical protein